MRKVVKPSTMDAKSVDLFDGDRKNQWGKMYCIDVAILPAQVDESWKRYEAEIRATWMRCADNCRQIP